MKTLFCGWGSRKEEEINPTNGATTDRKNVLSIYEN